MRGKYAFVMGTYGGHGLPERVEYFGATLTGTCSISVSLLGLPSDTTYAA